MTNDEIQKIRDIRISNILQVSDFGRNISLRCPFHNERTPSFILYSNNSFHCFGCKENGKGAIDFVMKLGYSFTDAIQELSKYL